MMGVGSFQKMLWSPACWEIDAALRGYGLHKSPQCYLGRHLAQTSGHSIKLFDPRACPIRLLSIHSLGCEFSVRSSGPVREFGRLRVSSCGRARIRSRVLSFSRARRPPCFWIVLDVTLPCVSDSYPLRFGCPSGLFFPVRGGGPSSSDKSIHVYPVSSPGVQLADTAVLWFRGRSPLQIPDGSLRVPPGC